MIPAGVVRLIWAIAPSPQMRDAMLGDLEEEFEIRVRERGLFAAQLWAWREAAQSFGEVLWATVPRDGKAFTAIVPALIWSYLVAASAMLAMVVLVYPALHPLFGGGPLDVFRLAGVAPLALIAAIIGGYEAARVGRGSPFWSAIALAAALTFISVGPVRVISLWCLPPLAILTPLCCLTGAVLREAQMHRLAADANAYR